MTAVLLRGWGHFYKYGGYREVWATSLYSLSVSLVLLSLDSGGTISIFWKTAAGLVWCFDFIGPTYNGSMSDITHNGAVLGYLVFNEVFPITRQELFLKRHVFLCCEQPDLVLEFQPVLHLLGPAIGSQCVTHTNPIDLLDVTVQSGKASGIVTWTCQSCCCFFGYSKLATTMSPGV